MATDPDDLVSVPGVARHEAVSLIAWGSSALLCPQQQTREVAPLTRSLFLQDVCPDSGAGESCRSEQVEAPAYVVGKRRRERGAASGFPLKKRRAVLRAMPTIRAMSRMDVLCALHSWLALMRAPLLTGPSW
jgi:hypothetical protein